MIESLAEALTKDGIVSLQPHSLQGGKGERLDDFFLQVYLKEEVFFRKEDIFPLNFSPIKDGGRAGSRKQKKRKEKQKASESHNVPKDMVRLTGLAFNSKTSYRCNLMEGYDNYGPFCLSTPKIMC